MQANYKISNNYDNHCIVSKHKINQLIYNKPTPENKQLLQCPHTNTTELSNDYDIKKQGSGSKSGSKQQQLCLPASSTTAADLWPVRSSGV